MCSLRTCRQQRLAGPQGRRAEVTGRSRHVPSCPLLLPDLCPPRALTPHTPSAHPWGQDCRVRPRGPRLQLPTTAARSLLRPGSGAPPSPSALWSPFLSVRPQARRRGEAKPTPWLIQRLSRARPHSTTARVRGSGGAAGGWAFELQRLKASKPQSLPSLRSAPSCPPPRAAPQLPAALPRSPESSLVPGGLPLPSLPAPLPPGRKRPVLPAAAARGEAKGRAQGQSAKWARRGPRVQALEGPRRGETRPLERALPDKQPALRSAGPGPRRAGSGASVDGARCARLGRLRASPGVRAAQPGGSRGTGGPGWLRAASPGPGPRGTRSTLAHAGCWTASVSAEGPGCGLIAPADSWASCPRRPGRGAPVGGRSFVAERPLRVAEVTPMRPLSRASRPLGRRVCARLRLITSR